MWNYLGADSFLLINSDYVDFSVPISSQTILVIVDSPLKKDTWHKAGYVYQAVDTGMFNKSLVVPSNRITFDGCIIQFRFTSTNSFLRFVPVPWLYSGSIAVYQYS